MVLIRDNEYEANYNRHTERMTKDLGGMHTLWRAKSIGMNRDFVKKLRKQLALLERQCRLQSKLKSRQREQWYNALLSLFIFRIQKITSQRIV